MKVLSSKIEIQKKGNKSLFTIDIKISGVKEATNNYNNNVENQVKSDLVQHDFLLTNETRRTALIKNINNNKFILTPKVV